MQQDSLMISHDKTLAAAGLILIYATVIGYTDNYVRVIAADAGLWQFHASRTVMALLGGEYLTALEIKLSNT